MGPGQRCAGREMQRRLTVLFVQRDKMEGTQRTAAGHLCGLGRMN